MKAPAVAETLLWKQMFHRSRLQETFDAEARSKTVSELFVEKHFASSANVSLFAGAIRMTDQSYEMNMPS